MRHARRGFALVLVLWVLAGLTVVAVAVASSLRTSAESVKLLRDRVRAEAAIVAAKAQQVEAKSRIEAASATVEKLQSDLADAQLKAARSGRVQHRLALPGEVLPAGGKVVTILDLSDVFMRVYLPETVAGRLALGAEARLVLDAAPDLGIPAQVSFVAAQAQFHPQTGETANGRQKLVFQVKMPNAPALAKPD